MDHRHLMRTFFKYISANIMGMLGLFLYFTAFPFAGINIISSVMLSATDRAGLSFIVSLLRGFLLILPCVFILSFLFHMTGVWISFPAAELLTFMIFLILMRKNSKKRQVR